LSRYSSDTVCMVEGENEDIVKKDLYTEWFDSFSILFYTSFYSASADSTLSSNFGPAVSRLHTRCGTQPTLQSSCLGGSGNVVLPARLVDTDSGAGPSVSLKFPSHHLPPGKLPFSSPPSATLPSGCLTTWPSFSVQHFSMTSLPRPPHFPLMHPKPSPP